MELRKKVKCKKRRGKKERRDPAVYEGRTHDDWVALPEGDGARTVQVDCVEGAQGDARAILALHFLAIRF